MIFSIDFVEKSSEKTPLHQSILISFLLRLLSGVVSLSQHDLTRKQIAFLDQTLDSDTKSINIRLRQGEYQFDLAKGIASFELQLKFPNAKYLIKKLYGEAKTQDTRFVSKIQTILKKMEKSNVIRILPKNKPWELQKYALLSFKFQDVDKNLVALATEDQIKQTRNLLRSKPTIQGFSTTKPNHVKTKIWALILIAILSYATVMWTLTQPTINPIILILSFFIASACSLLLGKLLAQR
jgi:hypothetical protein